MTSPCHPLAALLHLSLLLQLALSQPFLGINYGEVADNLPPPEFTSGLLQKTTISKLRLYGVNPPLIRALAGTKVAITIGTSNADIASLATDPAAAAKWVAINVASFMPNSTISAISVGNEVFYSKDATLIGQLVPAMQNLHAALVAQPLTSLVKVTTVNAMSILQQSDPPSSGTFDPAHLDTLTSMLSFLNQTSSPFMVNPYPYFAYQGDPRLETLAFCLFQPNPGRYDAGSMTTYTNMFDAQVAAVKAALRAAGFDGVEVVVAETGWPYMGGAGELGATVENAKAYNGNLVAHLKAMAGGAVETYLFELYDENLKGGAESEKHFGLYKPDGTLNYDAGLLSLPPAPTPSFEGTSPAPATNKPGITCTDCHQVQPNSHPPTGLPVYNSANLQHQVLILHLMIMIYCLMDVISLN